MAKRRVNRILLGGYNKKVSYRIEIARQHSDHKNIWPGQVAWLTL